MIKRIIGAFLILVNMVILGSTSVMASEPGSVIEADEEWGKVGDMAVVENDDAVEFSTKMIEEKNGNRAYTVYVCLEDMDYYTMVIQLPSRDNYGETCAISSTVLSNVLEVVFPEEDSCNTGVFISTIRSDGTLDIDRQSQILLDAEPDTHLVLADWEPAKVYNIEGDLIQQIECDAILNRGYNSLLLGDSLRRQLKDEIDEAKVLEFTVISEPASSISTEGIIESVLGGDEADTEVAPSTVKDQDHENNMGWVEIILTVVCLLILLFDVVGLIRLVFYR